MFICRPINCGCGQDIKRELYEIFSPASCLALFITNDINIARLVDDIEITT
jgi:hypothetical protein